MTTHIQFKLQAYVHDVNALYQAAVARLIADGLSDGEARQLLRNGSGINVRTCVQVLLDPGSLPGAEIAESEAEVSRG